MRIDSTISGLVRDSTGAIPGNKILFVDCGDVSLGGTLRGHRENGVGN